MTDKIMENAPDWLVGAEQRAAHRDPSLGVHRTHEEKAVSENATAKLVEDMRRIEEAKLETAKLKAGVAIPPPMAPIDAIQLEFATSADTATINLEYLIDPYLPRKCVVGFFGRGSTSKSSFLASMSALVSQYASTLWVSVEEPADWIKVRHIKCGGVDNSLAVVKAVARKEDRQGRIIGSNFNVYEHLEPSIQAAIAGFTNGQRPPLRLVVLDTAVGLTGWGKGESPNDDAAVKKLLGYLQAIAEQNDITIAVIGHANKGKHDHFADTVMGASAWTNSPRLSFVHAADVREDFAYVVRVAKTNLVTFGATYKTEPVHTLYEREQGPDSVLVKVVPGPIIWGPQASLEMFEEATKKPKDDEEFDGGHKQSLVDKVMDAVLWAVDNAVPPVTREMIHAQLGREVARREWGKVDDRLRLGDFIHRVVIESGPQNSVIYRKRAS